MGAANSALAGVDAYAWLQGSDVTTLQACLGGVEGAYKAMATSGNAQAAQDIAAVSGPCTLLAGGTKTGLVYPFDFPDPDVIVVNGTYFAYATNSVAGNIQIIQSTDRTHWTAVGNALPNLPSWAAPNATWAPGVVTIGGSFLLYYAVDVGGPGGGEECISLATATQPQGPFVDSSTGPLECQPSLGGSIDPFPFVDADGTPYLLWKSNGGMPATIWVQQLVPQGNAFAAGTQPAPLLRPDQPWEWGDVEAPDMVLAGGRYFLFFSGNTWTGSGYAEGVASCSGPLGPCTNLSTQPLLATDSGVAGPGGGSVFVDPTGAFWIAFHGFIPGAVGYPNSRDLFIRPLDLSGAVPAVG
ncbi:MAG: family 43 glycosylhydrolase [Acidimicrobiales bacterium]|nr:family 43 glycosylhydrolase [Acidimicrobiales bacterium]